MCWATEGMGLRRVVGPLIPVTLPGMNNPATELAFLGRVLAEAARAEIMPRFARLSAVDRRQKTSAFSTS